MRFSVGIHCRTGQSLCCVIKTLVFALSATSHLFYLQEDTDTPRISGTHSPNLDSFPVIFLLKVGFWTLSHHNHFKDHHHDYQYHAHFHSSQTEARILEKHLMESSSLSIAIQVELVMVVVSMIIRVMMMMVWLEEKEGDNETSLFRIRQLFPGTVALPPQIQPQRREGKMTMASSSVNFA